MTEDELFDLLTAIEEKPARFERRRTTRARRARTRVAVDHGNPGVDRLAPRSRSSIPEIDEVVGDPAQRRPRFSDALGVVRVIGQECLAGSTNLRAPLAVLSSGRWFLICPTLAASIAPGCWHLQGVEVPEIAVASAHAPTRN
jgi:hypothetical protein